MKGMKNLLFSGVMIFIFCIFTTGCFNRSFSRLSVNPVDPVKKDIFIGKGSNIEVIFRNESKNEVIDVFPEPPMTIRNKVGGHSCDIDGGIWVRQSVWLSNDEKTLIVQEYSGSNDFLVIYDTGTCEKLNELDVSDSLWEISGDSISISHGCYDSNIDTCPTVEKHILDKFSGRSKVDKQ